MSADYRIQVMGRIASRGVAHLVRYHGELPRRQALALQAKCSVGLVVETISPGAVVGIPVKMLEYMEAGLPVVYSSLPIVDKLLAGVDCGIPADARNPRDIARAIRTLIEDAARAKRLGLNGSRAVRESLNWEKESLHLLNLYRSICQ
jgi:glycosyltransferase involved in cell wall biosynthesis